MQNMMIEPGKQVCLHFSLSNLDGFILTSTFNDEPEQLLIGDGSLLPGLELVLYGLTAGDKQTITLTPEQAFGFSDPEKISQMPITEFPTDTKLSIGLVMAFNTPSGETLAGTIIELKQQQATVDFNHPFAGQSIIFKVHIIRID